jgi:hypothetical protein
LGCRGGPVRGHPREANVIRSLHLVDVDLSGGWFLTRRISSNPAAASALCATARLAEAKRRREAGPHVCSAVSALNVVPRGGVDDSRFPIPTAVHSSTKRTERASGHVATVIVPPREPEHRLSRLNPERADPVKETGDARFRISRGRCGT